MKWYDISELMRKAGTAIYYLYGKPYILTAVEREDGTGRRFILHLHHEGRPNEKFTHYIETLD